MKDNDDHSANPEHVGKSSPRGQRQWVNPIRSWVTHELTLLRQASVVQWLLFIVGVVLVAAGIGGGVLPSSLGAGPADAFFAGAAGVTSLTVGAWVVVVSVALLLFAWSLGVRPTAGSLVLIFLLGVLIDLALFLAPEFSSLPAQFAQWFIGAVLLAVGAGLTVVSQMGASAYDTATVAVSKKVGGRLGLARVILDGVALVLAWILGGPLAWGTVGLMVIFPLVMPRVVAWMSARVQLGLGTR